MKPLIEVENLSVEFENNKVFSGLNFMVFQGDFICIVGQNGAGKSTLIKTILGQIKPKTGMIKFHDLKRNFIGYMPQESKIDKNFPASVEEIVLSGTLNQLGFKPFYGRKERELVERNLKTLGIFNLAKKHFADLSGGQKQKVLLARGLSATTKLLILDEPSNNLDYTSKGELYKSLKEINQEGITILMITHDLDHKNLLGEKILALAGKKYFYGTTQEYVKELHRGEKGR